MQEEHRNTMKKKQEQLSDYEALEKQLLAVFRSGVYINSKDIARMGEALGYDLPIKEREVSLKKLIARAKKAGRLSELFEEIAELISERMREYNEYGEKYPQAQKVTLQWLQKAKSTLRLLHMETQKLKAGEPHE